MEDDTRNASIFADIFQFISKTKGLGENLATPRDAADIFPPETIGRSGKSPFVYKPETKEFGKTCSADSGSHARYAIL